MAKGHLETTPERSRLMARVRQRGTAPELVVRTLLRKRGCTMRMNGRNLPGSPDLYDRRTRKAIFVHGCFWHRHRRCVAATTPVNNRQFWLDKFTNNVARDKSKMRALRRLGYKVITVWECQLKSPIKLSRIETKLSRFVG